MRITILSPHIHVSGGTRVILKYSDLLSKRGHRVEVVVPVKGITRRIYRQLRTLILREPRWQPTQANIRFVPSLESKFLPPADATVATAWKTAKSLSEAGSNVGAKIYLVQAYESLYLGKPEDVDPTYRLGFRTVTVSDWITQKLRHEFGVEADTIVVPVDHEVFFPRTTKRSSEFRICMMYHEPPWKDAETALEAIRMFRRTGRKCKLVVFGITNLETMKQIGDEAHFQKSQSDLAEVYSSCDVFLWSSWYEGLGLPPMEAMACGSALVTTDTGGSRSYAIHEETALVAPQKDPAQLCDHLCSLYDSKYLLKNLQQAGREKMLSFQWSSAVDQFESVLRSEVENQVPLSSNS